MKAIDLNKHWRFLFRDVRSRMIFAVRWRGERTQFAKFRVPYGAKELADIGDVDLFVPEETRAYRDAFTIRATKAYFLCREHAGEVARAARCNGRPLLPMLAEMFPSMFIPGVSDPNAIGYQRGRKRERVRSGPESETKP